MKVKGERQRYTQGKDIPKGKMYSAFAEYQRVTRRDKKDFINEQCKEIEKNNRMGKTRDLVKEIGEMKGTFHTRMGMIKDRNSKDLTEAKRLRRCDKNTQNYTKKSYDLDDHDNMSLI